MATGHLENRYKSSWTIVIDAGIDPVTKERQRIVKSVKGKKSLAQAEMTRMLNELEKGTYVEQTDLAFGEFMERWLADYAKGQVMPRTYERYKEIIDSRIVPELGKVPIAKLKPMHLQSFYSKLAADGRKDGREGGLSPTTIVQHHRIIHKALETALRWQVVNRNVADAVDPPKKIKKEIKTLDMEQTRVLLLEVEKTNHHAMIYLASYTGMRRSELYGLRWQDIDFETGDMTIRRAAKYIRGKGVIFEGTKNKKGRPITLPESVLDALKKHKTNQAKDQLKAGGQWQDNDLLFCQKDGSPSHPDTITKWFPKFLAKLKLPKITFHGLRHTHATLLLNMGVHPKVVSERLGHSQIGITMDIYSHVLPTLQREATDKLEEQILNKINKAK